MPASRKFYATRHTFISIALSRGVNLKWLAEYRGTSVVMIERSYGSWSSASINWSSPRGRLRLPGERFKR